VLASYVAIVICFEQANWGRADKQMDKLKLDREKMPTLNHEALQWANAQMDALEVG
jgi:c-di-GMP-related signal transduction protein